MTQGCRVEIIDDGRAISLALDQRESRFHAIWLRDNALDPESRDQSNGQRLISVLDLQAETLVADAQIENGEQLRLTLLPDNKALSFPLSWLSAHRYDGIAEPESGWLLPQIELWGYELQNQLPFADYRELSADSGLLREWLANVRRYGIATLANVPCRDGAVCDVASLFGFVRETNYGRWFDVRAEIDPSNLAYTGLGLLAHTDNPYRDPVPTLQLIACMENSASGGASIVVDGFSAVTRLRDESPRKFDLLTQYCARFEFSGSDDVRLRTRRPMIELAPDGELICVRFNNRSAAPIVDVPYEHLPDYYDAYRRLAEIIESPEQRVRFRLQPGDFFIVDNTRVLHAREAYSGSGTRWLQGCYADKDSFLSTLAVLEEQSAS